MSGPPGVGMGALDAATATGGLADTDPVRVAREAAEQADALVDRQAAKLENAKAAVESVKADLAAAKQDAKTRREELSAAEKGQTPR